MCAEASGCHPGLNSELAGRLEAPARDARGIVDARVGRASKGKRTRRAHYKTIYSYYR